MKDRSRISDCGIDCVGSEKQVLNPFGFFGWKTAIIQKKLLKNRKRLQVLLKNGNSLVNDYGVGETGLFIKIVAGMSTI